MIIKITCVCVAMIFCQVAGICQKHNIVTVDQNASKALDLTIQSNTDTYESIQPIIVELKLRNITKNDVNTGLNAMLPSKGLNIVVRDESGKEMSLTNYGSRFLNSISLSTTFLTIRGNESISYNVVLNRLFDLSMSGNYRIQAQGVVGRTPFFNQNSEVNIKSNTIKVKVVDPDITPFLKINPFEGSLPEIFPPDFKWEKPPVSSWRLGDIWLLSVERYVDKHKLKAFGDLSNRDTVGDYILVERYHVSVTVTGSETASGKEYWKVQFQPSEKASGGVKAEPYQILVNKTTGETYRVANSQGEGALEGIQIDGKSILLVSSYGYPVELYSPVPDNNIDLKSPKGNIHFTKEIVDTPKGRWVNVVVKNADKVSYKIKERWVPDGTWWNEYEREVPGDSMLRVKRIPVF